MKNTKLFLLAILLLLGGLIVYRFWDILSLFLIALVLAYLLMPLVRFFTKHTRMKRGIAVFLVMLLFFALLTAILSFTIPALATQITGLVRTIQGYGWKLDSLVREGTQYLSSLKLPQPLLETLENVMHASDSYIASFLTGLAAGLLNLSGRLLDAVVIVVVTVYFMLDGGKMIDSFLHTLPPKARLRINPLIHSMDTITRDYIRSKCLISFGMAVVIYIGLSMIGLPNAMLFAGLSFILDFVPYFGSILAGVVETFFAFLMLGPTKAVIVALFVLIVQQIEGNVVIPKIQGNLSGIHPVTVMFAILAANQIWGPAGMLIAVPIAALCKIVLKEIYQYVVTPEESTDSKGVISDESSI
ncbi:AI-2E family transporter [Acidaminobacterium chupaoyuni]